MEFRMLIAGVDEVGRGPLAGPVVAAAVILDDANPIAGLVDSKKLSEAGREKKALEIRHKALAWAIARAEVEDIDCINILQASLLAMTRSIMSLRVIPDLVLVDGNKLPSIPYAAEAIVRGDQTVQAISAASIIAKVARDFEMKLMAKRFPGYGFEGHKGYPTKQHILTLSELGISTIHRRSFSPVRKILENNVTNRYIDSQVS